MSPPASKSVTEFWTPPAPTTGRKRAPRQRMLIIGVVVAMHVVLALMIAVHPQALGLGDDADPDAKKVVYITSELASRPIPSLPGLLDSSLPDAVEFARRAGLEPGKSARVVLDVKVTQRGVADSIRVAISSGSERVDAAAVDYARALRWSPVIAQDGRQHRDFRLPVVLEAPG